MKDQLFNRKVLFSLLAVVMCLGFTAMSYGAAVVSVDPATVESPAAGEELMVNINIMGGAGVLGYEVDVSFDPAALEYVSSANADYLPAGAFVPPAKVSDAGDSVKISAASLAGTAPDGDGTLAMVTFKVVEAKASTIGIANVILPGENNTQIEATTMDGMVTAPAADAGADDADDGADDADAGADDADDDADDADDGTDDADDGTDDADDGTDDADDGADDADAGADDADAGADDADAGADDADAGADDADAGADDADAGADDADAGADDADAGADDADDADDGADDADAVEMPKSQMFEITLTNLTEGVHGESGQTLSPAIFAAHRGGVKLFEVGQPASQAIVALAEGGSTAGLEALAAGAGADVAIAMNADMTRRYTMPGQSSTVTITADMVNSSLSVGSMLVSTNDAFIGVTDLPLFDEAGMPISTTINLNAYDAGSEDNTEMASDIPGPLGLDAEVDPPGSNARVPTEGGVIAAHPGIQGGADVSEAFAWTEPTATLMITPVDAPAEPMPEEPVVEEPMPEEPTVTEGPGFDVTLAAGLNMISLPLMPETPYTAKSLAAMLNATVVIQLDAATQSFVGYTVADEGDGFGIEGGVGYIVNTRAGGMVKFTGKAWDNQPEPEPTPEEPMVDDEPMVDAEADADADAGADDADAGADDAGADDADAGTADAGADDADAGTADAGADDAGADDADAGTADAGADDADAGTADAGADADAEGDDAEGDDAASVANTDAEDAPAAPALSTFKSAWAFVVTSDIQGMHTGMAYTLVAENLRTGIIATENVTSAVKRSSAVWADLNRKSVVEAGDKLEVALYDERGNIVSGPFQRTVSTADIRNAFLSLQLNVGDVQPKDTILAQNYPNPFNPETWIPYQLSESTEVSIHIHNVAGHLIRTLDLGLKPTGSYMTPATAAYWDGKNAVGESVASGIYFYTLQTAEFAATRRMVILK